MLAEIERRLESHSGSTVDSESSGWFDESDGMVVSSISFGRVLTLSSQSAFSASSRAMQLCMGEPASTEYNVLYVSHRLSEYDLACNLIAQASDISVDRLVSGLLTDAEWDRLEAALARIRDQELSVVHAGSLEDVPICDWLSQTSAVSNTTPLLVLDDAALLSGIQSNPRDGKAYDLVQLARVAANADALIVLVEETRLH
jgi:replicative DNA helicase